MRRSLLLAAFLLCASSAWATTRYVGESTAGAANCTSHANNCLIATAIAAASAGDTIEGSDGSYTGANSMLTCSGKSGSAGNPITFRALNDGAVFINGQDSRIPVSLTNCDYWIFEGINVGNSSAEVVQVRSGSDHNIFRRMIAWDACSSCNNHVWSFDNSSNNLVEDFASFGTGRKQFEFFGGSDNNVARRGFAEWNGSTSESGPIYAFAIGYDGRNNIGENLIGTRDEGVVPSGGYFGLDAIFTTGDRLTADPCANHNAYYGSIAYVKSAQTYNNGGNGMVFAPGYDYGTFKDVVIYKEGHASAMAILAQPYTQQFPGCDSNASGSNKNFTNISEIGFTVPDSIDTGSPNGWTLTNRHTGASVASVYGGENLFVNSGNKGATICYRYVDGVLTANPLWPWPMNQRIIDARATAGRPSVDVTATVESIFGTIPAACKPAVGPGGGGGIFKSPVFESTVLPK